MVNSFLYMVICFLYGFFSLFLYLLELKSLYKSSNCIGYLFSFGEDVYCYLIENFLKLKVVYIFAPLDAKNVYTYL